MDIRYYEVQENSDQTEGRGRMVTVGNFILLEDAVKDAQGRGVMGVGFSSGVITSSSVSIESTCKASPLSCRNE